MGALSFTGRLAFVFIFVSSGLTKLQTFDVVTVSCGLGER